MILSCPCRRLPMSQWRISPHRRTRRLLLAWLIAVVSISWDTLDDALAATAPPPLLLAIWLCNERIMLMKDVAVIRPRGARRTCPAPYVMRAPLFNSQKTEGETQIMFVLPGNNFGAIRCSVVLLGRFVLGHELLGSHWCRNISRRNKDW